MRGDDIQPGGMFSHVSLEARAPSSHPLRAIKALLDEALAGMSRDFNKVYAAEGRPSIARNGWCEPRRADPVLDPKRAGVV
jgi:hypothetical protein